MYLTITGNDYRVLKSQLSSGSRLQKPQYCPQHLFPFIKTCWNENPTERPSFTGIKEHISKDAKFPKAYQTNENTTETSLSIPTQYEVMRRNYSLIQRANPHYLSMSVRSYSSSRHTTETEVNATTDSANAVSFSYDLSTTPFLDDVRQAAEVTKDVKCSASDLLRFISEDNRIIDV